MGEWAKSLFGRESFESVGIVIAGTVTPDKEKEVLALFDKVVCSKDLVYHAHLVMLEGKYYPLVFNVYGAPAMLDVMAEMHDGGLRNLIFVGYAYGGFNNLEVGTLVMPSESYHYDGIYHHAKLDHKSSKPDPQLFCLLKEILGKVQVGSNISVPSVTYQIPHANLGYAKIKPVSLEMELAACFARGREIGIRTAGVLIISDNKHSSIGDHSKRNKRWEIKLNILRTIVNNLPQFGLVAKKNNFSIDSQLASVINDPKDKINIYRK